MASFHIENFGCRAARADGEALSARLQANGHAELDLSRQNLGEADIVLLNTCSVTAEADRDARAFLRKTRRLNPTAKVVFTGCYAQRAPEEIAALDGVTAVIGNSHKGLIPEIVQNLIVPHQGHFVPASNLVQAANENRIWADDQFAHSEIENAQVIPGTSPGSQTRPNLKIQEGCSNRCTFCIIPTTRGNSRSLSVDKVLAQVRGFVAAGGRELVLSGINLGRWGQDRLGQDFPQRSTLAGLLRQILNESELQRLRLSSIEPMDWTADLISLLREFGTPAAGHRLARHAHLPLQSGSDAVLRRMHRRYRPWHYEQKVAALVETVGPALALGADVMVGFPGETDAEFRETYDLIARLPFTYLHLFPFSPRPGTRGWELHLQSPVAPRAITERMATLRALIDSKTQSFRASFLGQTLPAITLHTPAAMAAQGRTSVLTDNFLPVELSARLPANQLLDIRITEIHAEVSPKAAGQQAIRLAGQAK